MKLRAALLVGFTAGFVSAANAQSELDDLSSPQPSELDQLFSGQDSFLEFDQPQDREPVAVTLRALDKITAKFSDLTVSMGETAQFGSLTILVRHCDSRPPEEFPETTAFLQIFDDRTALLDVKENAAELVAAQIPQDKQSDTAEASHDGEVSITIDANEFDIEGEKIFSGWMFASSPALNPLEHPVYDVWVIGCETKVSDGE